MPQPSQAPFCERAVSPVIPTHTVAGTSPMNLPAFLNRSITPAVEPSQALQDTGVQADVLIIESPASKTENTVHITDYSEPLASTESSVAEVPCDSTVEVVVMVPSGTERMQDMVSPLTAVGHLSPLQDIVIVSIPPGPDAAPHMPVESNGPNVNPDALATVSHETIVQMPACQHSSPMGHTVIIVPSSPTRSSPTLSRCNDTIPSPEDRDIGAVMVDSSATFDTTQTATEVHVDVVAQVSGFIPSDITGIPHSETKIEIVANSPYMEQTREMATTSILTDNVNMSLPPADISHVEPSTETPGTPTVITHVEIVNEAPHVEESSPGNSSTVLAPTEHVTQIILATPTVDDADIVAHVPSPSVPPVLEHELAGDGLLVVLSPSVHPAEYITDDSTRAMAFDAAEHLQYIMETTKAMVQEAVAASKEVHELLAEVRLEKSHAQTEREAAAAEKERMLEAAAQERQIGIAELNAKILEFSENLVAVQAEKDKLAVESEEGVSQMKALEEKVDHLQRQLESAEVHRVEVHVEHGRVLEELSAEKEIYVAKEKDLEAQLLAEKEVYDGSKKELEDKLAAIVAQQEEDKQLRDSESSERALVHEQREQEHTAIGHDLRAKIQALEDDLAAAVAKQEQDEQLRISEDAERSAAQDEHERIVTEVLLQKEESLATSEARIAALEETLAASVDRERILEETIAEQGERIRTMEEALAATRTQLEELEQNRVAEFEQRDAAMADAEAKHNADIASVQAQLEELEQRRVNEIAERDAALSEADEKHVASIADVDAKHSEALSEAEAKHTADIQAIQAQLEVSVAQREQEKEQQSAENAEREAAHAERERALLEDLERERANFEQHNALLKECNERISALGTDLQQERQQRVAETTEQREADKQESRERAEAQDLQVSEIKDKLAQRGEHSDELLSQQQTRISDICSQLDKIEEAATEERRLVAEERTQREEERAEAATKPSEFHYLIKRLGPH